MAQQHSLAPRSCLLLLFAVGACASQDQVAEESLQRVQQPLSGTRHQQTTRAAVTAWVNSASADAFEAVSTIGDSDPTANQLSQTHFDNCYWDEGRDWMIQKRKDAVSAAVKYEKTGAETDRTAFFESFGFVLHAAEDFYAHSNWVGSHEPGELANMSDPGAQKPSGWVSGTYDNPGDTGPKAGAAHCPLGTPPHSLLNKDGPNGPANDEAFVDATLAATLELQKLIAALRLAAPSTADSALAKLGFLKPEPSRTTARADDKRTLELAGAGVGLFTPPLFCQPGTYASGFEQRVEPGQGDGDDTALNAVALRCAQANGSFVERLSVWEGVWGEWSSPVQCAAGQFLTRGELKVEAVQLTGDNTAANAARFGCGDGTGLTASNDGAWGNWKGALSCEPGEAVCGLEIAYQPPQDAVDDVGMTGMRIHCCTVESGAGGAAGTAGSAGSSGNAGTGGTAGSAGEAGSGGAAGNAGVGGAGVGGSGTGGSPSSDAGDGGPSGSGGAATDSGLGDAGNSEKADDEAGCTCEAPSPRGDRGRWLALLGAIVLAAKGRSKRVRRRVAPR